MKKVLLFTFLLIGFISSSALAQSNDCATEDGTTEQDLSPGNTYPISTVGAGDEGDYTSLTLATNSTVFFNFTVNVTGCYELNIDAGGTPTGEISFGFHSGCPGSIDEVGTVMVGGIADSDEKMCLEGGVSYMLVLSTEDTDEGTFDISLTNNTSIVNDLCDGATTINETGGDADGILECLESYDMVNNINACPDVEADAGCGTDPLLTPNGGDPGVWYTFETGLDISEFEFVGAGDYEVFTGTCGGLVSQGCSNPYENNVPGTTYYVLVSGGTVTVQSLPTTTPANDLCVNAETISAGLAGDNTCATSDANACVGANDHVVYYLYTVPAGNNEDVTVSVSADGSSTEMVDGGIVVWEDCSADVTNMPCWDQINMNGQACALDTDVFLECVPGGTSGTTLIFAVSSATGDAGGFTINFTATPSTLPSNDDCASADPITTAGISSDNSCSTLEAGETLGSCQTDMQGTVWFTYDPTMDFQSVTFTLTSTGIANQFITAFDACTGSELLAEGNPSCDATEIVIECVDEMDIINIQVGSPLCDAGTFDIAVVEELSVAGDSCDDPIYDPSSHILECGETFTFNADPDACPDPDEVTCASSTDPGVWYYLEIDPDIPEIELTASGGAGFEVFSSPTLNPGPWDCTAFTSLGCGSPILITDMSLGYFVLVTGSTGSVELTHSQNPPATNEDCSAPDAAIANGTVAGNNICASAGDPCGDGTNGGHVVYFEYMTGATPEDITINLDASATDPAMTDGSIMVYEDCAGDVTNVVDWDVANGTGEQCDGLNNDVELKCVPAMTTIIIAIGSDDQGSSGPGPAEVGNFDLTLTVEEAGPDNDLCADAEDAVAGTNFTNICALGEASDCGLDPVLDHDVWYTYTPGFTATDITINVSADGANGTPATDVSVGIYDNTNACSQDPLDPCDATIGIFCNTLGTDMELSCITTPIVFYVGSADGTEGDFTITVTEADATPSNDECASPDPWMASVSTSNGCATGTLGFCGLDGTTSHDVWYEYTNSTGSNVDLDISVTTTGGTNDATDVSFVLVDPADCVSAPPGIDPSEFCMILDAGDQTIECIPDGTTIHIGFGSPDCSHGDFDITFTETPNGVDNDECDGTLPDVTPVDVCVFEGPNCTDNTNACPEDWTIGGCGMTDVDAAVWVQFTVPADVVSVEIENITGPGSPYLAIVDEMTDCTVGPNVISPCLNAPDGTNGTAVMVTAGNTYYILVASDMEGEICFDIKLNDPPDNDICDPDAEVIAGGATTAGTTECATADVTGLCNAAATSTVWYEYTVPAGGLNELTIDVTNFMGATDDISLFVLMGCGGAFWNQADMSPADYCGTSGTELLTLTCLEEGDVLSIAVASDPMNEGTFDITVNEDPNVDPACVDNDLCDDAGVPDMGVITTDDPAGETCIAGECNTLACPDAAVDAICGSILNAVFYQFTTDGDPNLTNGTQVFMQVNLPTNCLAAPIISVFEGDPCSIAAFGPMSCLPTDDSGNVDVTGLIMPNTTYTIVVGTTDNEGCDGFDVCVEISTGCANDECVDAIDLDATGGTAMSQNTGCTMDGAVDYGCGDTEVSSAWYSFTMPAGTSTMTITVTPAPASGYSINVIEACGDGETVGGGSYCASSGMEEIFCLAEETTYWIQISTVVGEELTFDITVEGDPPTQPEDLCSGALEMPASECMWEEWCFDTNIACPENITGTGCAQDEDPTVWGSITLPTTAYAIEFREFDDPSSYLTVLADDVCPPTTFLAPDCVSGTPITEVPVTGGTTLNIMMSNEGKGEFCFEYRILVAPAGDDPFGGTPETEDDIVMMGAGGGNEAGFNCCAIGANDDPGLDLANMECAGTTDDDAVWYSFTTVDGDDGYQITVNFSGGAAGSFEVYEGVGGMVLGSDCTASAPVIISNCFDEGTEIAIKIASAVDDCGDFTVTVEPYSVCEYAETCDDAPEIFTPATDLNGEFQFECLPGCLTTACPEETVGECGFNMIPTVWFQVDTDADAAQLYINVTTACGWDPVFAVYEGDCPDGLMAVGTAATPICNTGWANPEQINQPVMPNTSYWIAVGASGFEAGMCGDFEICITTTITQIICLGDGSCTPAAETTITDEDGVDITDDVELGQKLCQGGKYTICTDFFYDASETGVDWLIGVVPIISGWDDECYVPEDVVVTGNGMTAEWFDENILQEQVNTLCTYTDDNGNLQLCNVLCGGCPCTPPMAAMSIMPGGWYWVSNGGNTGCENDGTPGEGWGIGSTQANVDFCMDMLVPTFETQADCFANDKLDWGFQTFSDGVAGCWEDPVGECLLDENQFKIYEIECEVPPATVGGPDEICTGDCADLQIATEDNSNIEIIVTVIDNPNVTGEMDHMFVGVGVIDDCLTNTGNQVETVMYEAYTIIDGVVCPGPTTIHEVIVYPELVVEFEMGVTICYGEDYEFEPDVEGGTGTGYSYAWDTGETTNSITVPQPVPSPAGFYTYCVTVTDNLGCTGEACGTVEVKPPLDYCLQGDTDLCKDGIAPQTNDEFATISSFEKDPINTTPILNFEWCYDTNDGGDLEWMPFTDITTLWIDEINSDPGTYTITLKVEDIFGCEQETEPWEFTISEPPMADWEITNCDQSGTEVCFTGIPAQVTAMQICDSDGNPLDGANTIFDAGCHIFTELGDYTLKVINTLVCQDFDNCDCVGIVEFTLDPPLTPEITVPPVCVGEDATATVENPTDFTDIIWLDTNTSDVNGYTITGLTQDSIVFIEYTDVNGCTSFGQVDFTVLENPMVEITGPASLCIGSMATYDVNILNEDSDLTYNYNWSPNGQTTSSITETINGDITFCVTVTTAEGCEGSDCIDVTTAPEITLEPFTASICETDEITIGIDGSVYSNIQWDDAASSTTDSITVSGTAAMSPLVFIVTFRDVANDCDGSGTFTIEVDALPQANVTDTVTICNNALFGSTVDLTLYEGTSDPGVWTDVNTILPPPIDPTNLDFDGFAPQNIIFAYTTNIAGDSQCPEASDTLVVKVEDCNCDEVNVGVLPDFCADESGEIFIGGIGFATNDAEADWAFVGGSSNMTIQGDTVILYDENTAGGTYTIEYTLNPIDPNCVGLPGNSATTMFTIWEQPTLSIVTDTTVCNADVGQGEVCLNFNNFILNTNGIATWTADPAYLTAGGDFSDLSNVCFDFAGSPPNATYFFTVDVPANGECSGVTETLEVTTLDCDCGNPNTNGFPVLCNSGGCFNINDPSITGSADPGGWSLIAGGTGDISTLSYVLGTGEVCADQNTEAGTYIFQYTLNPPFGGTCIDVSTQTLTVLQAPSASFNPTDTTACNIIPAQGSGHILDIESMLTSSDNGNGMWTSDVAGLDLSDPSSVDFASINGNVGDVVTITYTTSSATDPCEDVSATITITLIDCDCLPIDVSDPEDVCAEDGTLVDLCALIGASDPGDWTIGTASNGGDATTVSLTGCEVTVTSATAPGTYEFVYTLNPAPADGCTLFDIATLVVLEPVDAGVPNETPAFCEYETGTVTLADLLDDEDAGGMWSESSIIPSTGGAFDDVNGTFTIDGQAPGSYTFVYSFDANGPCPGDMETVEVIIEAEPMADAGPDGFTDCTNLTATIGNLAGSSQGPEFNYYWVDSNGDTISTDMPFETDLGGVYTLIVENGDTGCFAEDMVEIVPDPDVPGFEASAEDSDCFGDNSGSINITGASGGTGDYIVYVTGDLDTSFVYTDPSNLDGLPPGSYVVMLEDSNGCPSAEIPLVITENAEFIITDVGDVDSLSFGTEYTLGINEFINPDAISQVIWTVDGEEVCAAPPSTVEECQEIVVLVERAREVCITLIDTTGCVDEDCLWLRIQLENDVYPPNVFDPNLGDDNGWLFPQTSANGEEVIYFRVFDRWGELMFENSNFPPNVPTEGWDGTFNGKEAVQGVYVYQYEVRFENGELRQVATDATLIR